VSASPILPSRAGDDGSRRRDDATSSDPYEHADPYEDTDPYEQFLRAVAAAQLAAWLPSRPSSVLDISRAEQGRHSHEVCAQIAAEGHHVIRVLEPGQPAPATSGSANSVVADGRFLDCFRQSSVDAVVAEGSALSSCLAAEATVEQAARVLRPGGRMLLTVDSLLQGLASLAEQHRWPELADAGAADVVLVPAADEGLLRCFGPDELHDLVVDAGFDVEWVRPRTVLPPDVVRHAIERGAAATSPAAAAAELNQLVASELELAAQRQGESLGLRLTLSARRRP
jgi:hypothetical protein